MIYEVLTFEPTEALLADAASTLAPATKFFTNTDGFLGLYYGPCEEDKSIAFMVIVWETHEHFKALVALPGFPGITGLAGAMKSKPTIVNVPFQEPPEAALSAGSSEVLAATLKPGKTTEDLGVAATALLAQLENEPACIKPCAMGETIEEPGKFIVFVGWTSTKAHYEAVTKASEVYMPLVDGFKDVVEATLRHATFTKYA